MIPAKFSPMNMFTGILRVRETVKLKTINFIAQYIYIVRLLPFSIEELVSLFVDNVPSAYDYFYIDRIERFCMQYIGMSA